MSRPSWDVYFLRIAKEVASRSTCLRIPQGIGAVLVRDNRILSTGYAGSISGMPHCTEAGCMIGSDGGCRRTVHAETNAVLQAGQHGVSVSGSVLYTTMSPCWNCFKMAVSCGVSRIVYAEEYRKIEDQKLFAKSLGIPLEKVGL